MFILVQKRIVTGVTAKQAVAADIPVISFYSAQFPYPQNGNRYQPQKEIY